MQASGSWLALVLLCASPHALGAPRPATFVRTSLDDDERAPMPNAEPRRIRSSLDDPESPSRAAFPQGRDGRLIRLSLEEGTATYGRLSPPRGAVRRVRTTLD